MVRYVLPLCIIIPVILTVSPGQGKTLLHWSFDGPLGEEFSTEADIISGVTLLAIRRPDVISDVRYGRANPWFNSKGTSAEFDADFVWDYSGAILAFDIFLDSI